MAFSLASEFEIAVDSDVRQPKSIYRRIASHDRAALEAEHAHWTKRSNGTLVDITQQWNIETKNTFIEVSSPSKGKKATVPYTEPRNFRRPWCADREPRNFRPSEDVLEDLCVQSLDFLMDSASPVAVRYTDDDDLFYPMGTPPPMVISLEEISKELNDDLVCAMGTTPTVISLQDALTPSTDECTPSAHSRRTSGASLASSNERLELRLSDVLGSPPDAMRVLRIAEWLTPMKEVVENAGNEHGQTLGRTDATERELVEPRQLFRI